MPLSIKTKFDYWKKCNDLGEFRNPRRFFLNPDELRHILKALVETFSFKKLIEGQKRNLPRPFALKLFAPSPQPVMVSRRVRDMVLDDNTLEEN